jgi:Zn-dependent hydrolases, including glyoxylases
MLIGDGVRMLEASGRSHVYLVETEPMTLIDTGFPGQGPEILEELRGLGVMPETIRRILLTHHDVDHVGNAELLREATGAELWCHELDAPYILGEKPRPGIKRAIAAIVRPRRPVLSGTFSDRASFGELSAIHAPGHTPGHTIFAYERVLFIGDLFRIEGGQPCPMAKRMTADPAAARASIAMLKGLDFEWLCPAHGEPIRRGPTLEAFLADY